MEQPGQSYESHKFASPEEELKYLRERVASVEGEYRKEGGSVTREAVISQEVTKYAAEPPERHLEEHFILENPQFEESVNMVSSASHREQMRRLYGVLAEKGVLNALKVARELNSPHLEDDFHSVLVHYIKTGAIVPGLDKERDLLRNLNKTLYEVTVPHATGDKMPTLTQAMEMMERFYSGMLPGDREHVTGHDGFTLELASQNYSTDIVYYIAVKKEHEELFKQQLFGTFPGARIEEIPEDYNIFNGHGVSIASVAVNLRNFAFPLADMSKAEHDPTKILLSSFSKVQRDGEGAAVQFVVLPDTLNVTAKIKYAIGKIREGAPLKTTLDIPLSTAGDLMKSVSGLFKSAPKKPKEGEAPKIDNYTLQFKDKALELLEEKLTAEMSRVNLRIVASAATKERANEILSSIESAFNQFTSPQGNGLRFVRKEGSDLKELLRNYTFRRHTDDDFLVLNTKELSALFHFPVTVTRDEAPQLKTVQAANAPAPVELPTDGTVLGVNKYRGEDRVVRLTKPDRLRHLYTIGQTGTGKSVFLKNLAVQDIIAGNGVCFIDPHGSDVQDVLAAVPKERIQDVIYFDPSYTPRPFALNMLEYDVEHPEQKIFVVNEMLSIFRKLYSSTPEAMGPAFEQYFRNATMLVMEDPETGNTLLEIPRVMADPAFRNLKLSRCKNPLVVQFWRDIATKTSGESGLQNMIPYITNKFDVFLSNDVMRPIIAQEKSSFNFRDIMDNKKILLVNLAKGKLGDINANLIGLVLVGKILMAAMSRVDSFGKQLPDFYLYIDEFQNITTDSISAILSEARKYGLSLNVAHQFIAQLDESISKAVFGNVGNMVVFRVGAEDAEALESQFAPVFKAADIMKIENRNAYVKMLINGKPVQPFNISMLPPPSGNPEIVEQMKQLSYLRFGKERKLVDDAILAKYLTKPAAPAPAPAAPPTMGQITQQWAPAPTPPIARPPIPAPLTPSVAPLQTATTVVPAQPAPTQQSYLPQQPPQPAILATPVPPPAQQFPAQAPAPVTPAVQSPFAQAFARASIPQSFSSDDVFDAALPQVRKDEPSNVMSVAREQQATPAPQPPPTPVAPQAATIVQPTNVPTPSPVPPRPQQEVVTPLQKTDEVRDPFETLNALQQMSTQQTAAPAAKIEIPLRPSGGPDPYREPIT